MSVSRGGARRYPYAVARYAGLATPAAFADLDAITGPADSIRFFTRAPLAVPASWTVTSRERMEQMLATRPLDVPRHELVPLADRRAREPRAGRGQAPFLHVKAGNDARALYARLGFTTRAHLRLTVAILKAWRTASPSATGSRNSTD